MQQVRRAARRVPDTEQAADQRGDPGQRPPLTFSPAVGCRALIQRGPQPVVDNLAMDDSVLHKNGCQLSRTEGNPGQTFPGEIDVLTTQAIV